MIIIPYIANGSKYIPLFVGNDKPKQYGQYLQRTGKQKWVKKKKNKK